MGNAASTRVALALGSTVLVGLILATAHAARPDKPAVAEVDAAINAGELLRGSQMQEANPYTRGCKEITLCLD